MWRASSLLSQGMAITVKSTLMLCLISLLAHGHDTPLTDSDCDKSAISSNVSVTH